MVERLPPLNLTTMSERRPYTPRLQPNILALPPPMCEISAHGVSSAISVSAAMTADRSEYRPTRWRNLSDAPRHVPGEMECIRTRRRTTEANEPGDNGS